MKLLLILSAAAALVYLLRFCHAPVSWPKTCIKTTSVGGLALAMMLAGGPVLLILALLLCAIGDYWLSRDGEPAFLAGVGAFGAGHIAYVVLFLSLPQSDLSRLGTALGLCFLLTLSGYGAWMMRKLWLNAGPLRPAVLAYVPIILAMGFAAATVPGIGVLAWVLPAAGLFMVSDSVLAAELFLMSKTHPLRRLTPFIIWGFYWMAQAGFVLAFIG